MTSKRAIFERRMKHFTDPKASFDGRDLATEIGVELVDDEFCYEKYIAFRMQGRAGKSMRGVQCALEDLRDQNQTRLQIGQKETDVVRDWMPCMYHWEGRGHQGPNIVSNINILLSFYYPVYPNLVTSR